ncbi:hypothetical protein SAMN03159371_01189 [Variovorax sp. NFACC28]|nr:hypothetical protein SAMN03159371_01189 [Variovorax sp. NFACC28]SEF96956.1 hypothetical protein SAMN03159365_01052 [Variovorax sp. NFACC29]SFB92784.1 hypothetical protein SAMN03159379_01051 [Variovorax sp. NFACC26]SFF82092.1 hypothetical protein SAMN03159447_00372 [Variovorax sp. NFACC27]
MYSSVKRMVNTHSSTLKTERHCSRMDCTLSRITTSTLVTITAISARSNIRPARVSASKITVKRVRRQPCAGLSKRESVVDEMAREACVSEGDAAFGRVMAPHCHVRDRLIQLRLLRNEVPQAVSAFLR